MQSHIAAKSRCQITLLQSHDAKVTLSAAAIASAAASSLFAPDTASNAVVASSVLADDAADESPCCLGVTAQAHASLIAQVDAAACPSTYFRDLLCEDSKPVVMQEPAPRRRVALTSWFALEISDDVELNIDSLQRDLAIANQNVAWLHQVVDDVNSRHDSLAQAYADATKSFDEDAKAAGDQIQTANAQRDEKTKMFAQLEKKENQPTAAAASSWEEYHKPWGSSSWQEHHKPWESSSWQAQQPAAAGVWQQAQQPAAAGVWSPCERDHVSNGETLSHRAWTPAESSSFNASLGEKTKSGRFDIGLLGDDRALRGGSFASAAQARDPILYLKMWNWTDSHKQNACETLTHLCKKFSHMEPCLEQLASFKFFAQDWLELIFHNQMPYEGLTKLHDQVNQHSAGYGDNCMYNSPSFGLYDCRAFTYDRFASSASYGHQGQTLRLGAMDLTPFIDARGTERTSRQNPQAIVFRDAAFVLRELWKKCYCVRFKYCSSQNDWAKEVYDANLLDQMILCILCPHSD